MSNNHTAGSGGEAGHNGNLSPIHKDTHSSDMTGALPMLVPKTNGERGNTGASELDYLLQSLHDLFEHDRQIASQQDATRCGICYLYFPVAELLYREEGFYVCSRCEQALGHQYLPMLRKQQKL